MTALADRLPLPVQPREDDAHPRRRLTAVPRLRPKTRPSLAHVAVLVGGLVGILVAQLMVSVSITEGAYTLSGLQSESATLANTEQQLAEELDALGSPQYLASQAEALGMVPGQASGFLQLSTGAILPGADALHTAGTSSTGAVPNALLTETPAVPTPTEEPEPEIYPGMLLPVEGVANEN